MSLRDTQCLRCFFWAVSSSSDRDDSVHLSIVLMYDCLDPPIYEIEVALASIMGGYFLALMTHDLYIRCGLAYFSD